MSAKPTAPTIMSARLLPRRPGARRVALVAPMGNRACGRSSIRGGWVRGVGDRAVPHGSSRPCGSVNAAPPGGRGPSSSGIARVDARRQTCRQTTGRRRSCRRCRADFSDGGGGVFDTPCLPRLGSLDGGPRKRPEWRTISPFLDTFEAAVLIFALFSSTVPPTDSVRSFPLGGGSSPACKRSPFPSGQRLKGDRVRPCRSPVSGPRELTATVHEPTASDRFQ